MGHPYALSGHVEKGNQLGRTIGYPTANIHEPEPDKLLPAFGIYAVQVRMESGDVLDGMLSIGIRPTIGESPMTIEVNIFDFNQDIYGQHLSVLFIERLRDELKFDGLEPLKAALGRDELNTKEALSRYKKQRGSSL
jgi:riboflavin kinase/FMN adenylyltransferase